MQTPEIIITIGLVLNLMLTGVLLFFVLRNHSSHQSVTSEDLNEGLVTIESHLDKGINQLFTQANETQRNLSSAFNNQVDSIRSNNTSSMNEVRQLIKQEIETVRTVMTKSLDDIRKTTDQKINDINVLVNEKLSEALSKRLTESFSSLNDNFNKVQQELGKMQSLADDVSGLKSVLTASKTRGIFGEVQLERILSDYLLPTQYRTNVEIRPRSGERVEFVAVLPGDGNSETLLPIDAKFPMVSYENMLQAIENGNQEETKRYSAELHNLFRKFAKDIHDKYIDVPVTTEYAIMFLPSESIFIEALKNGTAEMIRTDYHIIIAGPSNMAVILNSLQMGFKALQMKKYSSEVWKVLATVKTEFAKFAQALEDTQKSIAKAGDNLDKLVGTRSRALSRKLKDVEKGVMEIEPTQLNQLVDDEADDLAD